MQNEVITRRIILILIVAMVTSICATILVKTQRESSSKQNNKGSKKTEIIDEKAMYGVNTADEKEYTIETEVDTSSYRYGLPGKIKDGEILFTWCWSFKNIEENLANIAGAGYNAIQTSVVNQIYDGDIGEMQLYGSGQWNYQKEATDWVIGNYQLGTKEELKSLCSEAKKYGISIIVEVMPNQIAVNQKNISEDLLSAVGGFSKLIHNSGKEKVAKKTSRLELTSYKNSLYPDTDTENPKFQNYFIGFLNDCIATGVSGFRYDQADYIALEDDPKDLGSEYKNNFWDTILKGVHEPDKLFVYGDVSDSDYSRIGDYAKKIGMVTGNAYSQRLRNKVRHWELDAELLSDPKAKDTKMSQIVSAIENYDDYVNATWDDFSEYQIRIAWAIIASRQNGIPIFFNRPEGGGVKNGWYGSVNKIGEIGSDLYKDSTIIAINRFRNAMTGQKEKLSNPKDNKKILVIERGDKGVVIVNMDVATELDISCSMEDGEYSNRAVDACKFTVKDGKLKGKIPKESIVILYKDVKDGVNIPTVSAEGSETEFYLNEITLTLKADNAEHATYSFGGKSYKYESGKKITLGKPMKVGDIAELTLKAINKEGVVTEKVFPFKKAEVDPKVTTIRFEKPDDWAKDVYVYVYSMDGMDARFNAAWPGMLMDYIGNGIYQYQVTSTWLDTKLVFSDSLRQFPKTGGVKLLSGKTYGTKDADQGS